MRVSIEHAKLKQDGPSAPFDPNAVFPEVTSHPVRKTLVNDILALCNPKLRPELKEHEIIYISSAPPRYMGILGSLFPNKFRLYHTHMAASDIVRLPPNVEYIPRPFDDKEAEELEFYSSGTDLFVICNMRSQEGVMTTMMNQMKWIEDMHPINWSIDFGWDYTKDKFSYLGGQLFISPFGKPKCPELRLNGTYTEATGKPVLYDYKKIRECMFHHNTVVRANRNLFAGDYKEAWIDNGYDWSVFMYAMRLYLETQKPLGRPRKDSEVMSFAKQILRLAK